MLRTENVRVRRAGRPSLRRASTDTLTGTAWRLLRKALKFQSMSG